MTASDFLPISIGINPFTVNDANSTFADSRLQARAWGSVDQPYTPSVGPAVDSAGDSLGDGGLIVYTVPQNDDPFLASGRYTVTFTGQAVIGHNVTAGTLVSSNWDPATNTTTHVFDVAAVNGCHSAYFTFAQTRRLPTDAPGTGIKNLKIMRPTAPGALTSHDPTEYLARCFGPAIWPFRWFRTMDFTGTNEYGTDSYAWSDRTLPSDPSQAAGRGTGMSIEHMIKVARSRPGGTPHDLWWNVPHNGTDDHYTKSFQALKYGTDGVLPYTGPAGSAVSTSNPRPVPASGPLWPGAPGKVLIEYSNETWNDDFQGGQTGWLRAKAAAQMIADPSVLAWDGLDISYHQAYRYMGLQVRRIRDLAAAVWGEDGFNRDFGILLGNRLGTDPCLTQALAAIAHAELVAGTNRPTAKIVTSTAGGWYHNWNNTSATATVDEVYAEGLKGFPYTALERTVLPAEIASSGYEGNINCGMDGGSAKIGIPDTPLTRAVNLDQRAYNTTLRVCNARIADGLRILMVFNTSTGPWAIAPGNNTSGPQFRGFADYARHLELGTPLAFSPLMPAVTAPQAGASCPPFADAGFEAASLGVLGNAWAYLPGGTPWTFASNAGVTAAGSSISQNNPAPLSGSKCGFVQNVGSISQTVAGWAAGSYTIAALVSLRGAVAFAPQAVDVLVDGTLVGTLIPPSTDWAALATPPFAVAAGSHLVTFIGRNLLASATDCTAFIDAVAIQSAAAGPSSPTPTPSPTIDGLGRLLRLMRRPT